MRKVLAAFLSVVGLSGTTNAEEVNVSQFERAVLNAKTTQDFMPVWEAFVNTQFYVSVIPMDSGSTTENFRFSVFQSEGTQNQPAVLVSESLERLGPNSSSSKAIKMAGAKLVQMLNPELGIVVGYRDGGFGIPKEQVQWLRESIQPVH